MSNKKHYNYNNNTNKNVDVNVSNETDEVISGVTPNEGDNSINETDENDVVNTETTDQDVSVADTQESDASGQEDGSATIDEELVTPDVTTPVVAEEETTNDESDVKTEEHTKDETVAVVEEKKENAHVVNNNSTKVTGHFISLGVVNDSKMPLFKHRLTAAGVTSASLLDDELVVGPFVDMATCIATRKKIVSKGLKCRIIEK